jgi:site-specific DNA-cytosine methylase
MSGYDLTHASFFSGVGGTDLGLESAGWQTVSFSEVDPYANAVLAERWPGIPNLGDIVRVAAREPSRSGDGGHGSADGQSDIGDPWHAATLWSGGFPCQDLSVAGKRAGFAGERSVLAFAFLDLVERHRPPAVLLENVPGLLSSHRGRDMAALLGRLAELGYGVAYRILDARHFGVPQRRRRVFIIGLRGEADDPDGHLAADRAAEVLAVGTRCDRHLATGVPTGEGAAGGVVNSLAPVGGGPDDNDAQAGHLLAFDFLNTGSAFGDGEVGSIPSRPGWSISPSPDPGGVRATDGLAGRSHDRSDLARPLISSTQGGQRSTDLNTPLVAYTKSRRAQTDTDDETWVDGEVMPTLNSFDVGDVRTTAAIIGGEPQDDPLLPLGLDSHRYRCCGNGVVAPVAEWIGVRLAEALV